MSVVAANFLRPHKWKLYDSREAGLLPDGVLRRCVNDISHADLNALVAFCERFGDVSNFEVNPGIGWGFVRDPWVDGAPRLGVWRLLGTRVERMDARQVQGAPEGTRWRLVQELAEGWLEELRGDECRLVEGRALSGDGDVNAGGEKFYTLRWVGVSPDKVEALANELASTEVLEEILYRRVGNDGLTVTEKLEGTWRHLASRAALAEDGSGVVEWTVADPQYVLTGFAGWLGSRQRERVRLWNVPEALAQGLIDAAKAQGKSAEGVSYDDQNGLVNLVIEVPDLDGVTLSGIKVGETCDSTSYASFAWGVGNKDLLPIPETVPAGTSYQRRLNENGDGTFSVVLSWEVRTYRDVGEYTREFRADQSTARKEWLGWTNQDLGTALNAQSGKVVVVSRNVREDCSVDISRDVVSPVASDTDWVVAGVNERGVIQRRLAQNQTLANAEVIADSDPGGETNWLHQGSISGPNAFGLYDVQVVATVAAGAGITMRSKYSAYAFSVAGNKRQWSSKSDGVRQTRLLTVTHYYAGNTQEAQVKTYLEAQTGIEGVRISPNGDGTFFQGYGYVIGTPLPGWEDDDADA